MNDQPTQPTLLERAIAYCHQGRTPGWAGPCAMDGDHKEACNEHNCFSYKMVLQRESGFPIADWVPFEVWAGRNEKSGNGE
jgi:hypothetical protein